ncbi:MAG: hypothetical protein GXP45_02720 [bacterium]|nr:hypothetical protein [bacterium]
MLAFVIGSTLPLVFQLQGIPFQAMTVVQFLVLFLLLSGMIGLLIAIIPLLGNQKKVAIGTHKRIVMPFIPAMILAFWILLFASKGLFLFFFSS